MDFLFSSRSDLLILAGTVSLLTFGGTLLLLPLILIRIPEDYFLKDHIPSPGNRVLRLVFHLIKNLLGTVFLIMGFIMLFIPGQGLLTIMAGLWLMDLPGKRKLEIKLVRKKTIYKTIDLIRKKAGKTSLKLPEQEKDSNYSE